MYSCKICGEEMETLGDLSKHLRSVEKIKQKDYADKHWRKKDRWNKKEIPFKTLQQYDETDFLSRENFRKWAARRAEKEELKTYCFEYLTKRAATRGLKYFPSHVELRAINCLSVVGFESLFSIGEYENFCESIGLQRRFDYTPKVSIPYNNDMKIFVDTREQAPLTFPCSVEVKTLNVGDYACDAPSCSEVVIERKSMEDFVGTLGGGEKRFEREVMRAKEKNIHLVVVIEEKFGTVLNYKDEGKKCSKQKFGMRGASPFGVVRKFMQKFDNIQFLFANDRQGSADKIKSIFGIGNSVSKMDLQYHYDKGEI